MALQMNGDKDRRPKDTQFKQQKLPAWQPIMTAGTVLPAFFAIGIAFIPLGVALLITSNSVQEVSVDYTKSACVPKDTAILAKHDTCAEYLANDTTTSLGVCQCDINITLAVAFKGQVYMYYGLTNYYQNHRRYVKSRDDNQLNGGSVSSKSDLSSDCEPYRANDAGKPYGPCGAIANSLFNDRFTITRQGKPVNLTSKGIAWDTDVDYKFKNPKSGWGSTVHPERWSMNGSDFCMDASDASTCGYQNEELIVWMRTAALPTFRKLHRKLEMTGDYEEGLPAGEYVLSIDYRYPVTAFEGYKRFIITTTSWMGGKNPFLGIAYLVVGSICVVLGIVFLIIHIRVGKDPSQMSDNVNPSTPY